jgi:hypothetical protein
MGISAGQASKSSDVLSRFSSATSEQNDAFLDEPTTMPQLHSSHDLYQNSQLQFLAPAFRTTSIRSILLLPLQDRHQCIGCLSVFRQEVDTEALWVGRQKDDERNVRPRQSFEIWMLIGSNFGLVATVNKKMVVKAPDWFYASLVHPVAEGVIRRSYTPVLEGDTVAVVMEPRLEVRCLKDGRYVIQEANAQGKIWIPELGLFLGIWAGEYLMQTTNWLRWWDGSNTLLLWSAEQTEQERQRAEQERQRAERLTSKLPELGIDPKQIWLRPK